MTIREEAGFLNASGKDESSIYTFVCLIDSKSYKKAMCLGEGMNYMTNIRFLYKITLSVSDDDEMTENFGDIYT